jgi:hypothetical protein
MKAWTIGLVLLALAGPAPAAAQTDTATLVGTIRDSQGGVLPGVALTARNIDTGFALEGTTDREGRYRIAAIPPGRYELSAALAGFATTVQKGIILSVGAEAVISLELSPASVSEVVTIVAEVPVVETTTAAVQTVLNREQIDLLPIIGREYTSLLRLMPGAASNTSSYSFVGSRGRSNAWTIDGVDNSEDISGYSRQTPALDSIQEVQVVTSGYKAEYGTGSGGVINVVTRAGTNEVRGSGLFLYRNQDFMSMSPYADRTLPQDPFQRMHYGATVGGPLKRDKLHYFLTYEREDRDTNTSDTRTLPPSTAAFAPSTLQFLRTNGIDLSLFGAGGRFRQVRPEYVDIHRVTARVDNQLNPGQFLTVRYSLESENDPSGTSGTLYDFNGSTAYFRTNYATINHKWLMSRDKLNEAFVQIGQSYGDWVVAYPNLRNVTVTGNFSLGGTSSYPQRRTDYVYQFLDNFTWTRSGTRTGEHAFKAGGNAKIFKSDGFFDSNFRGTYTFPTLNAFLQGTPSRFTTNQGDSNLPRPNQIYAMYVQDDWRPTTGLTLNLGVRYDYEGAKTEALRDVSGAPGPGISGDKNNVSPRVGFAWAPGGGTTQVVYGNTGLNYDQVILNVIGNARFTPPKVIGLQIDNPAWPDPFGGGTVSIPPPNVSIIDPDLVTPYSWTSQIGYRRQLRHDIGLDVSFVYNRGDDQIGIINVNAGAEGTANINGVGAVRPDRNYGNKNFYTNFGEIRYKGLLVDVKKRFSGSFQGGLNYTLSKTMDNAFSFASEIFYPNNPELNWGPGDSDRRHRIVGHIEYEFPWGLQSALIAEYATEQPLSITVGRDINGDGITNEWVHESVCRTLACPGFRYSRNSVRELPTAEANKLRALFGFAPIDEYVNNPKYFNTDLTLQKRLRITGRQAFRITAEAFNVFNIPQRTRPNQSVSSTLFGTYTAVDQPRAVQFTLQFDF